jgi:hypothetical protein
MLLSVPLTMIVKIGLESSQSGGWLSILLSDDVEDIVNQTENIEQVVASSVDDTVQQTDESPVNTDDEQSKPS